jgi:saccharopine dehydrogenase-like NADP-dependent oxidoreductase
VSPAILVAGGYGQVGRRIAARLARRFPDRVVVAGRDERQASLLASDLGHGARSLRLDVEDGRSVAQALSDAALVVACVRQHEPHLVRAAVERGLGYADAAPFGIWRQAIGLRQRAETTGACVVIGTGLVPGIGNVLARAAAERVGALDAVHTSVLLSIGDAFGADALDYLIAEVRRSFVVGEGTAERRVRSFTEARRVVFPAPVGARVAYRMSFSDLLSYRDTLGARTSAMHVALDPPWLGATVAALARLRLTSLTRIRAVRSVLQRALGALARRQRGRDRYALLVEATGVDGARAQLAIVGREESEATALGTALVVEMLHDGRTVPPGVWFPEQVVPPGPFLAALATAGMETASEGHATDSAARGL